MRDPAWYAHRGSASTAGGDTLQLFSSPHAGKRLPPETPIVDYCNWIDSGREAKSNTSKLT